MSIPLIFLALFVPTSVLAHGQVNFVSVNYGNKIPGPNVTIPSVLMPVSHFFQIYYNGDAKNRNTPVRTMYKASGPAFTTPADYTNSRCVCFLLPLP
jgi:hypothetical protein